MSQQQQNSSDQTANFFWYLVLLTVAVILIWFFEKKYIIPVIFAFRRVELDLLKIVAMSWDSIAGFLHLPLWDMTHINKAQHFISSTPVNKIDIDDVSKLSKFVGKDLRYPVMAFLIGMGFILIFKHRSGRFVHTYSMKTLKMDEVENWPQITPVISLNLLKEDLDKGPWAMAKLPLDFCKENNLLKIKIEKGQKTWTIDEGATEQLFTLQMGPHWDGLDKLPIHVKALVIIFMGRSTRQQDEANALLEQIAASASHGKLNFAGVEEKLQKYKEHRIIQWLSVRHAYVGTFMASLLEIGRSEGVLATAEFLWLKPVDRRLWYILNSVGRSTAVVEVAGLFAHWLAEKKLQHGLRAPMTKQAVEALELSVSDILYVEEGDQWRTNNAA